MRKAMIAGTKSSRAAGMDGQGLSCAPSHVNGPGETSTRVPPPLQNPDVYGHRAKIAERCCDSLFAADGPSKASVSTSGSRMVVHFVD
jgi:hypothetical protein